MIKEILMDFALSLALAAVTAFVVGYALFVA
jgi:hypothetical protein